MLIAPFSKDHLADPFGDWPQWRKDMGLGPHRGADWNGLNLGTPIPASGPGRVVWRTNMTDAQAERTALGHRIVIAYPVVGGEIRIGYNHLRDNPTLALGAVVDLGDSVGLLGSTGTASTGNHLHMTASWTTGDPGAVAVVDPIRFLTFGSIPAGGAGRPIQNDTNKSEEDDMTQVITITKNSKDGTVKEGQTYANPLTGPITLLAGDELGAHTFFGRPVGLWTGDEMRAVMKTRGRRPFDPKTGRTDYTRIEY